jgi:hypothetical protein
MLIAARGTPWPLDHHNEKDPALVPTANPAHTPAVDAVAQGHRLEQAQELGFKLYCHP